MDENEVLFSEVTTTRSGFKASLHDSA